MDVYRAIRIFYDEKKRLDKLIESLEELQKRESRGPSPKAKGRRGRKKMSLEERREVSERMKNYWAARRKQAASDPASQSRAATTESGS